MSTSALDGPKSKLVWASAHINELKAVIDDFDQPYSVKVQTDFRLHEEVVLLSANQLPAQIGVMAGNVIYNFRSALDLMTCALAVQNGCTDIKGVYFPFAKSASEFLNATTQKKIRSLDTKAQSAICSFRPYADGDQLLWALNELGVIDRHRSLIEIIVPTYAVKVGDRATLAHLAQFAPNQQGLRADVEVYRAPRGKHKEYFVELLRSGGVVFGDVEPVKNQDVVRVLQQFGAIVQTILETVEIEFFR